MKIRTFLYIATLICTATLPSCSDENMTEQTPESRNYELSFDVATRATDSETDEKVEFRSLYIYAYDDANGTVDFYKETGISRIKNKYAIQMSIQKEGKKRFYVIANPPSYIANQLTATSSEANLQSLMIAMQGIAYNMSDLPQNADGVSDTGGDTGFPMANRMTAYARLTDAANRRMTLHTEQTDGLMITTLPVIRCLGKISVKAYLGNGNTTPVKINNLSIYRFAGDGYFLPVWEEDSNDWKPISSNPAYAEWNSDKKLNLTEMGKKEEHLITNTVSVLPGAVEVDATEVESAKSVTSFYLCQNSYGEAIKDTNEQAGLEDTEGNRATRLVVGLSDGRSSEKTLPYLRRNDHLTIYLKVSAYAINFDFKVWNLVTVTPDWKE